MSVFSTSRPLARLVGGAAAATAACALVLGAGVMGASTATPAAAAATSTTATSASFVTVATTATDKRVAPRFLLSRAHLRAAVGKLPAALRADFAALKGKSKADRRAGVVAIEKKAVAGGYGTKVEAVAKQAVAAWASAPASLKTDLKSLRKMAKADRKKEVAVIEAKALKGSYGAQIESLAKEIQVKAKASSATV